MTEIATSRSPSDDRGSTAPGAVDQAKNVGQTAAHAGGEVAQTVKEQGREVTAETARQARNLVHEAKAQLGSQTQAQQQRAAGGLRALGDEIRTMSEQGGSGPAAEIARQAAQRVGQAADWLESREPGAVLAEVKNYARRNPGTFLIGAALLGVVAGRLTRGLTADASGRGDTPATRPAADTSGTGSPGYDTPGYGTSGYPEVTAPSGQVYQSTTADPGYGPPATGVTTTQPLPGAEPLAPSPLPATAPPLAPPPLAPPAPGTGPDGGIRP